ncbi:MAG: topology modulation protein [Gammaproteobacteria bacterium]|nr:topology modulation protein [Gammaproteobacteria bacterium]
MHAPINRILVVGSCGAGKTCLSFELARITGLPIIHLDQYYWLPNWQELNHDVWGKKVQALCEQPRWIMDGHFSNTLAKRASYADLIIWVDTPRYTCLIRILWRWLKHLFKERPGRAPGCKEKLSWEFIQRIWQFPLKRKPMLLSLLKTLQNNTFIVIVKNKHDKQTLLNFLSSPNH